MTEAEIREQLNELSETQAKAWKEYRKTNDQRLEEIEKKGVSQAVLDEKLDKIEKDVSAIDGKRQELIDTLEKREKEFTELQEKIANLEAKAKEPDPAKGEQKSEAELQKEAFDGWCRNELNPDLRKYLRLGWAKDGSPRKKEMTSGDDTTGGYLTTPDFEASIIKEIVEFSPIRALARVRPTTRGTSWHPKRTGTFSAQWVAEYAASSRSETTGLLYGREEIPNHELSARVDCSFENLEDSEFNLEAEFRMEFSEQFAVAEATAFMTGDGVGKPEGITTSGDVTTRSTSGSSYTIAPDDLIDAAYTDLKEGYARSSTWLFNRAQLAKIRQLKDSQNQYLWVAGFESNPSTILGRPYREATDLDVEDGSTSGLFVGMLGDFRRGYVISDRIGIMVTRDPYTEAEAGAVKFVARKRVGGQVVLGEAIVVITTA